MGAKNRVQRDSAENIVRQIRWVARRRYSADEKIGVVPHGLPLAICSSEGLGAALR
jgi:hypothetical protein